MPCSSNEMTIQQIQNAKSYHDVDDDSWTEEEISDSNSSSSSNGTHFYYYYEEVEIADDEDENGSDSGFEARGSRLPPEPPPADNTTNAEAIAVVFFEPSSDTSSNARTADVGIPEENKKNNPDESSPIGAIKKDRCALDSISRALEPSKDLRCGSRTVGVEVELDKTVESNGCVDDKGRRQLGGWFDVRWIRATTNYVGDSNPDDESSKNGNETKADKNNPVVHTYFGCIALRDIPEFTLIHAEDPILQGEQIWTAMERDSQGIDTCRRNDDEYLRDHCKMTEAQRQRLWSLHDQRNNDNGDKRLMGIVYSNAFCNSDRNEPTLFAGPATRLNHSCSPNVGFAFDGPTIRLFTTRRVLPGEELFYCYNDVVYHHSARVRRAFLKHTYGFDCTCAACNAAAFADKSDRRRRTIACLSRYLSIHAGASFLYIEGFEDTIRSVREEDEGLESFSDTAIFPSPSGGGTSADTSLWQTWIEYLALLCSERLDHDLLQCHDFGYDWAVELHKRQCYSHSAAATETAPVDHDTVLEWGSKTLALYELQKGSHHATTNAFRIRFRKWRDETTT